jgi:pilus assembly protein CpaC
MNKTSQTTRPDALRSTKTGAWFLVGLAVVLGVGVLGLPRRAAAQVQMPMAPASGVQGYPVRLAAAGQPEVVAPGAPTAVQPQTMAPGGQVPGMQAPVDAGAVGGMPPPSAARTAGVSEGHSRERALIADIRETELTLDVEPKTSKVIRTRRPVARISITHPELLIVTQFSPTELELIGLAPGETSLTFWFSPTDGQGEAEMLRYLVRVGFNEGEEEELRIQYRALERKINELFPNSLVRLIPIGDKLVVRGQARDSREAGEILQLIGGENGDWGGGGWNNGRTIAGGAGRWGAGYGYGWGGVGWGGRGGGYGGAGGPGWRNAGGRNDAWDAGINIINMLDVPGEKQVLLKVRIAEISRTALREIGTSLNLNFGDFSMTTNLGVDGAIKAVLSTEELKMTLDALSSNGYSKVLAEPNLVTLSGHPAYFIAGGEFAVPTTVGVEGVAAVTTTFRGFGTQVRFTPVVLDKDRVRLEVSPSFSSLNAENTVEGIPGLTTRAVTTTVDLREGQWLAIAGLIQDQQEGTKVRVPFLGDIPVIDFLFSKRHGKRDETELLVLVSPELVHPLEPEEAPLILPGMEVTEPTDCAFFFRGDYEGRSRCEHRSTVWPVIQREGSDTARQDTRQMPGYQRSADRYVQGPHGFTR